MVDANDSDPSVGQDVRNAAATRTVSRRKLLASGAGAAALTGLAGCSGVLGGDGGETVTMVLTPGTPSDVETRYKPMQNMIEGEVGIDTEMQVPQDYSAIRPALESEQAEIGMDDITLISNPDLMDVYGTTVTGGTAWYFSMMLTHPDSDVDERTDLEGRTVAFADRLSTSGSIFAVYALKQAGLDVGDAPDGDPVDFEGSWSNHDVALEKLGNDEVAAACTYGGNGMPHIASDADLSQEVQDKSAALDTIGSESPTFRPFWFSFPIPKQPVYARASWDSDLKDEIRQVLLDSDQETIQEYYPDGYNEEQLPFTTLQDTSIDDYQPVIKRLNDLGIELSG